MATSATINQQNSGGSTSGSTLTATLPVATTAGRTLLIAAQCPTVTASITTPAGFAQDATVANVGGVGAVSLFRKATTAGETSWPVTVSGNGGNWWVAEVSALSAAPLDRIGTSTGASSTSVSATITTATSQLYELAVAVAGVQAGSGPTFSAWTNSFVEQVDRANGGSPFNGSMAVATRALSATSTYAAGATISASGYNCALIATYKVVPRYVVVSTDPADLTIKAGGFIDDPAYDPGPGLQLITEADAYTGGYNWRGGYPVVFDDNMAILRSRIAAAVNANQTFLAVGSPTTADTLAQVQQLSRQVTALARFGLFIADTVDGT